MEGPRLRTAAELDNFRKRTSRDMQDARAYANADLLRGLLPVLDTFEMGLEAARAESEQSIVFQGMKMVQGMFTNFLREVGAEEVPAQGLPFDPNLHEALSQEASSEVAEGLVIRVQRRGYKLKDRLLRPANVVVSSGPRRRNLSSRLISYAAGWHGTLFIPVAGIFLPSLLPWPSKRDYYEVLGVAKGATPEEVKEGLPQARGPVSSGQEPRRQHAQRTSSRKSARPTMC